MTGALFDEAVLDPVARYLHLTREVMPRLARAGQVTWPVREDHCFQRIVLDAVVGDVWYAHLARPAYKHLSLAQARRAVALCEGIIDGSVDVHALNRASLRYRGKSVPPAAG